MDQQHQAQPEPLGVSVAEALRMIGGKIGRSTLYDAIKRGELASVSLRKPDYHSIGRAPPPVRRGALKRGDKKAAVLQRPPALPTTVLHRSRQRDRRRPLPVGYRLLRSRTKHGIAPWREERTQP